MAAKMGIQNPGRLLLCKIKIYATCLYSGTWGTQWQIDIDVWTYNVCEWSCQHQRQSIGR